MDEIEEWIEELKTGLDEDESEFEDADRLDAEWRDTVRLVELGVL